MVDRHSDENGTGQPEATPDGARAPAFHELINSPPTTVLQTDSPTDAGAPQAGSDSITGTNNRQAEPQLAQSTVDPTMPGEWPSPRDLDFQCGLDDPFMSASIDEAVPSDEALERVDLRGVGRQVSIAPIDIDENLGLLEERSPEPLAPTIGPPFRSVRQPSALALRSECIEPLPHTDVDEGDWGGSVAAERPDGFQPGRPPFGEGCTGASPGLDDNAKVPLNAAQLQLQVAMRALRGCETQLLRAQSEDEKLREVKLQAQRAQEAKEELARLRQDLQRLKGLPRELASLSNTDLHTLQQELSTALRNVHIELENRTKCCVCRSEEREVLLLPCNHLALCRGCANRVSSCPLCRQQIQGSTSVKVA